MKLQTSWTNSFLSGSTHTTSDLTFTLIPAYSTVRGHIGLISCDCPSRHVTLNREHAHAVFWSWAKRRSCTRKEELVPEGGAVWRKLPRAEVQIALQSSAGTTVDSRDSFNERHVRRTGRHAVGARTQRSVWITFVPAITLSAYRPTP